MSAFIPCSFNVTIFFTALATKGILNKNILLCMFIVSISFEYLILIESFLCLKHHCCKSFLWCYLFHTKELYVEECLINIKKEIFIYLSCLRKNMYWLKIIIWRGSYATLFRYFSRFYILILTIMLFENSNSCERITEKNDTRTHT